MSEQKRLSLREETERFLSIYRASCSLVPAKNYFDMEFPAPDISVRQLQTNQRIWSGFPVDEDNRSAGLCDVFFLPKEAPLFSGSGVMTDDDRADLYWGGEAIRKGVRDTASFFWLIRNKPEKTMAMWILATLTDQVKEYTWSNTGHGDTKAGKLLNEAREILGDDRPSWHHRSSVFLKISVFDYLFRLSDDAAPSKVEDLIGAALATCTVHNEQYGIAQVCSGIRDPELAKQQEISKLRARLAELE